MTNLHSLRSYSLRFVAFIIIAILVMLPNQRAHAQTAQAPSNQDAMLNPDNLEKDSYRLWLACFQAWKQGGNPNVPNLGIADSVDQKEAQRAQAVWERSKMRAFFAVAEKDMYQESLNWWRAKAQGQQMTPPVLKYPDVFDEAQIKHIEAVWQQGYDKAHLIVFEEGAYQTWLDYYQVLQQGGQPTLPDLSINEGIKSQEAKKVQAVWTRAQARAQRKVGQTVTAQAKQPSVAADNIEALSDGKITSSLPDVVIDDETRKEAARSYIPLMDAPMSSNAYPQQAAGFNQPTTVAALSSFPANGGISQLRSSPQPNQMGANSPEAVTANNNRLITESNGEIRKAKTTVNIDTAKKLIDKKDNREGRTNINTAAAGGTQLVRRYTYGTQGPISMSQLINGQWVTSYFVYDGEGNIRMLTDANGNVTDTYDYDAWGNLINHTGNTPNNRLYHGEEWDPDLSMYYLRSRYYQPAIGRFFTMDSFEGKLQDPSSLHKYTYVHNNPINNIDPSGLFFVAEASNLSGIAGTLSNISSPQLSITKRVFSEGEVPKQYYKILEDTIHDSATRISRRSDCKSFFQALNPSPNQLDPSFLIELLYKNGHITIGRHFPDKVTPFPNDFALANTRSFTYDATGEQSRTVFNQDSPFFTGILPRLKPTSSFANLSINQFRELAVLHELGHIEDKRGTYDDLNDPSIGVQLNFAIRGVCF